MIKDKPVLGHGNNHFEACYMNYQAAYFKSHQNMSEVMLTDNP